VHCYSYVFVYTIHTYINYISYKLQTFGNNIGFPHFVPEMIILLAFATVLGSSINSWDSRKINTCYYTDNRKRQWLSVVKRYMYIHRPTYILNVSLPANTLMAGLRTSLYNNAHVLNNVHTWASVFLRPLVSMSFMVPFWAPALSPFRGACIRSHVCPEEVVYSLNDSCSHFTRHLFPPNVLHQRIVNILL
jgi:hypothetical protein